MSTYETQMRTLQALQVENAALKEQVARLEGIIRHASQVKTLDDNLIAELEAQNAELRAENERLKLLAKTSFDLEMDSLARERDELKRQRDEAVQMLADWCDEVRDNGTGWDDWDEHYKDAAWRQCGIRELIDAARTTEGETE